jgi:hypothetical protein
MTARTGRRFPALAAVFLLLAGKAHPGYGYVLNRQIADSNDPRNAGVSACPLPTKVDVHQAAGVDRRWDTTLGPNIRTTPGYAGGPQAEVQAVIQQSLSVWAGVAGSGLAAANLAPLGQTSGGNSCTPTDGLNTICFAQNDNFASGVLAFTRTVASDAVGQQLGAKTAASVGEILDADVLLNPAISFATPGALAANPAAYDLETILIHELGHTLGLAESPVTGAAMFPFAPAPGTYRGDRPSPSATDAPLADDDRAGLRVLYPGSTATGVIRGRILPANPLSLANLPETAPGMHVTGYYGTHVVALDADTGQAVAGTLGGYSCDPAKQISNFDGSYEIGVLPLGHRYKVYVEPLAGPVGPTMLAGPLVVQPCRLGSRNPCNVPAVDTNFSTRVRP